MDKIIGHLFQFTWLFFIYNAMILAQSDSVIQNLYSDSFTRHRFFFGYGELLPKATFSDERAYFFNYNYRSTAINRTAKAFKTDFAFEPGLNFLLSYNFNNEGWKYTSIIMPYVKTGPEVYFGKNIFLAGNVGLGFALTGTSFYWPVIPFLFAGLNSFYLLKITESVSLEFEGGFHTFAGPRTAPFVYYVNIGFSFN